MPDKRPEFVREQINAKGLMCLICIRCEKLVAYSDSPRALAIAEAAHANACRGPISRPKPLIREF
jgi:hypothetical protein